MRWRRPSRVSGRHDAIPLPVDAAKNKVPGVITGGDHFVDRCLHLMLQSSRRA
jgi:hypothetical protein